MIEPLSLPILLLIFGVSAVVIWFAGIKLSKTADILATHFSLGEALGGMILLAIVTNHPEIVIAISATLQHNLELDREINWHRDGLLALTQVDQCHWLC